MSRASSAAVSVSGVTDGDLKQLSGGAFNDLSMGGAFSSVGRGLSKRLWLRSTGVYGRWHRAGDAR